MFDFINIQLFLLKPMGYTKKYALLVFLRFLRFQNLKNFHLHDNKLFDSLNLFDKFNLKNHLIFLLN